MKCKVCHKHFKQARDLDHDETTCPDCSQIYETTVQLRKLFEEIIVHHVVLSELRNVYRRHWDDIVAKNAQKQPI